MSADADHIGRAIVNSFAYIAPSIRQRYAMAALTGLCANDSFKPTSNEAALIVFRLADAMITAERE